MKIFIKIFSCILLFFGFIPKIFYSENFGENFGENFIKNTQKNTFNENYKNTKIYKNLKKGDFNPINLLTLKQNFINPKIFTDDENILRFVNQEISLTNILYKPKDLVSIGGENINQAGRSSQIRQIAKKDLDEMAKEFSKNFGEPLIAISGYRSAEYQQRLWDLGRCDEGLFCAKPGYSEHQLGLAVDFFDATSETQYLTNERYKNFVLWMKKNAYKHGWTQSYKHGVEIDGYEIEPWHWRYIGKETAKFLYILDMSYSRYLSWQKNLFGY